MVRDDEVYESIENIINDIKGLRDNIFRLTKDKNKLKDDLIMQSFEMELCKNIDKARALNEENKALKQENLVLRKQIEQFGNEEKNRIDVDYETIKELYNKGKGLSAYKIGQMYGYTQNGIRAKLEKNGDWVNKLVGNQFKKEG